MLRSILVPLDGSTFGEHAIPVAAGLARKSGAVLHLVHVHQPAPPIPAVGFEMVDLFDLHLREDELAYLADLARRVQEQANVPVQTTLLAEGDVAHSLREFVNEKGAELLVLSTHGRGTLGRWWLGAVADELARTMPCPVVLVRPEDEGKADFARRVEWRSILIALDGTATAEQIIEPAIKAGEPFGASFALVRTCSPVIRSSYLPEGTTLAGLTHSHLEQIAALQRKAETECHNYLDGVAKRLAERGLCVSTHVPVTDEPAEGILVVAKQRRADAIAIETHARRGLSRLFMGSIADKVVRGGGVPVLLNRPAV